MKHVAAPLVGFELIPSIEDMQTNVDVDHEGRLLRRYPVRFLRYWFVRHLLSKLHSNLGRPLRVLEVGVGGGKMLAFMGGNEIEPGRYALPPMIERWDALSADADPRTLERYSYSSFRAVDLDGSIEFDRDYDAVVALHVLEHLLDPEVTMARLRPAIVPGGLLIGGSPTMPHPLAMIHEPWLRYKFASKIHDILTHRHLSVITSWRIRKFAWRRGLSIDLLTGAFLLRRSRSSLEDRRWWVRLNLAWGALFPALGGEIYFSLRKPSP